MDNHNPTKIIQRLSEEVVNRIAAGEVIQRPANAVKELIENSLDAKSSNIQVVLKEGGLKYLQIQDNGVGIRKDDMGIVCERFTTSKLQKYEDLSNIATFGFRGEALASISHVAHVTITSRTPDSQCAFKGCYTDSKLKGTLKPCAGNVGTQIVVEDLFFNVPTRKRALRSPTEEHQKVVDVISRYAVHNAAVGFTVKKQGESNTDVRTTAQSSQIDNIRLIYGPSIARELLDIENENTRLGFKLNGLVTNANYSTKKPIFLLFINHRLVDSSALRKAIENIYAAYLPKGTHPFLYLSLEITPQNIDVNIHPTKHEVHFLHEDEIIESIQRTIDTKLLGANNSRTYFTQTLLPTTISPANCSTDDRSKATPDRTYAHEMVRTDSRDRKIDAFFGTASSGTATSGTDSSGTATSRTATSGTDTSGTDTSGIAISTPSNENAASVRLQADVKPIPSEKHDDFTNVTSAINSSNKITNNVKKREIKLSSVLKLRKEIETDLHTGLQELLQNHTFVGVVDPEWALIQHQTKLFMANTARLSKELFYQILIFDFGNLGIMRFSEKAPLYDLAMLALNSPESGWTPEDGPKHDLAQYVASSLQSKSEMLSDYFSLEIDQDGNLCSLPLLLEKYLPQVDELPKFVLRLATEVDWDEEKNCFKTFAMEVSNFLVPKKEHYSDTPSNNVDDSPTDARKEADDSNWKWTMEHVLYPAFRTTLIPPKALADNGCFLQIANLPDLYKVFERC